MTKKNIRSYTLFKNNNKKINPLIRQLKLFKLIILVASKEKTNLKQLFDPISTGLIGLNSLIRFPRPTIIRLVTIIEKSS